MLKRWWDKISYMGVDRGSESIDIRQLIMINRTNFIFLALMAIVSIVTSIVREVYNGAFTIHTQKLLILLLFCIGNLFLLNQKRHKVVAAILIFFPSFILLYLPIFFSAIQISDYIFFPISLISLSIVPQILFEPRLNSKIYVGTIVYFLVQLFFFDRIINHFSGIEFAKIMNDMTFFIYFKIILIVVFIFIHAIIFYLRALNQRFEVKLIHQNKELSSSLMHLKESQELLVKAEKMASLGVLTAGVAHEINNPINYIANGVTAIELILQEKYESDLPELKPYVDAVNTGIQRVSHIVKSLSKYSRSETLPYTQCNLHEVIDDCLLMVKIHYENRIEIVKKYYHSELFIEANEGQIHQVILNILVNAIHAIPNSGIITIATSASDEKVFISISDSGCGISEEVLKHIFDPFFTTKEPGEGTGLGLSICQNIMKEHNGNISCTSELNKGTQFQLTFPR